MLSVHAWSAKTANIYTLEIIIPAIYGIVYTLLQYRKLHIFLTNLELACIIICSIEKSLWKITIHYE